MLTWPAKAVALLLPQGRTQAEVGVPLLSCGPWCLRLAQANGLLASSSVSVHEGLLGRWHGRGAFCCGRQHLS